MREEDRNFLRFLWFQDNDLSQETAEYRMTVHIIPQRWLYTPYYSLFKTVNQTLTSVKQFVTCNFHVVGGLKSLPTVEAAVDLLRKTQEVLANSNLSQHKIATNSKEVMEAFLSQDHASDLKDLDLEADTLPIQRSLVLNWDLKIDSFIFKVSDEVKPFTRQGVLSTINNLYDPLGFVAPVTIQSK